MIDACLFQPVSFTFAEHEHFFRRQIALFIIITFGDNREMRAKMLYWPVLATQSLPVGAAFVTTRAKFDVKSRMLLSGRGRPIPKFH
jgi:hypothetical protein